MKLLITGVSHKTAPVEVRECLAFREETLPAALADLKGRAETKSTIAVGVMIAGGATIAAGAVMLYLNRGREVYPTTVEKLTPSVTPMPGGATLDISGHW